MDEQNSTFDAATFHAADQIEEGFQTLAAKVHGGDEDALLELLRITREMVDFLDIEAACSEGIAKSHLLDLATQANNWPINLPVEMIPQEAKLKEFNAFPFGSKRGHKLHRPGMGRPPNKGDDDYASVALNVFNSLGRMQKAFQCLGSIKYDAVSREWVVATDEWFSKMYWGLPVRNIKDIRGLPEFGQESLDRWAAVATNFLKYSYYRELFIPKSWKEKSQSADKTLNSFIADRIKKGLLAHCPTRGK